MLYYVSKWAFDNLLRTTRVDIEKQEWLERDQVVLPAKVARDL
jgi:hypothetical protein